MSECPEVEGKRSSCRNGSHMNTLGLFWTDSESKFSPIVRRRFRNTSSRLMMTVEVCKN